MEAGGHHLCTLLLPYFSSLVSHGKELVPSLGAPILMAAAQGTPLCCLALVASGAYAHGSDRTVTNGERVLSQLPPPGYKKQQTEVASLSVKEA